MNIQPADETTLLFSLQKTSEITERAFIVTDNGAQHLVLVNVGKNFEDTDGNGTIETLDGKFTVQLVNNDEAASAVLVSGREIKVCEVHSLNIEAVNNGTEDIYTWIADVSAEMIPKVVRKKSTLTTFLAI
ncbi:hypothetical protein [Pseudoalteromonas sp. BDTF-M6]|uniref:hypothetical protein n=1 Tax=Pseudoalteromonas sp. BDTF-M6 TaxID=2796132 RepID=UPI001BAF2A2E|nr:hypothetical protein [Pseudoalteromonas sp. BDTF-M6]MBS3796665.1 hypothetical protein [Pseudoalteromonas sp. BDTF-M6]